VVLSTAICTTRVIVWLSSCFTRTTRWPSAKTNEPFRAPRHTYCRTQKDSRDHPVQFAESFERLPANRQWYEVGPAAHAGLRAPVIAKLLGVSLEELVGEEPRAAKRGPSPSCNSRSSASSKCLKLSSASSCNARRRPQSGRAADTTVASVKASSPDRGHHRAILVSCAAIACCSIPSLLPSTGSPPSASTNRFAATPKRFPADFMFQLTAEEISSLRSNLRTLKLGRGQHRKYLPVRLHRAWRDYGRHHSEQLKGR